MDKITTIFFDIDNTLFNHTGAETKGIEVIQKKHFPIVDQKLFETVWKNEAKRFWQKFEQKELSFAEQRVKRMQAIWRQFEKAITPLDAEQLFIDYLTAYEQSWEVFPAVIETLTVLKQGRIKLGILSNGGKQQQIQKLQKLGVYQFIDPHLPVISEEAGFAKPDQRIFQFAQEQSKRNLEEILFVGDNLEVDILPARNFGWKAILVDYFDKYPQEESVKKFRDIFKRL